MFYEGPRTPGAMGPEGRGPSCGTTKFWNATVRFRPKGFSSESAAAPIHHAKERDAFMHGFRVCHFHADI